MSQSNRAQAFINSRREYIQEKAPMYYTTTPGDIHHRERVVNMSSAMFKFFDFAQTTLSANAMVDRVIENQVSAEFDVSHLYAPKNKALRPDILRVEKAWDEQITPQANRIYCSYHLGSYRLIVGYLLSKGVDVALLVTDDVMQQQIERIYDFHQEICTKEPFGKLTFFNAESFNGISDAVDFYQAGGSLLIYIDGNSGIGGMGRNDNRLLTVDFLNRQIKARKGVAFLSRVLMADIFPVFVRNNDDGTRSLITSTPIKPNRAIAKSEYIEQTTKHLFDILAREINREPESWEGWLYIHKVTCTPQHPEHQQLQAPTQQDIDPFALYFNDNAFALLQYPGATVLLNIRQFKFHVLSATAVRAIRFVREKQNVLHVVKQNLVEELIRSRIILQGASNEQ
ncbi:hypothetical protein tloyanaT_24960 [Thalassotalea loyana]|uniref:Lipid A biosynthesis lauroyl acyltransferase n=1 Tax=Thalassotalea loyana TaxID=280483 RepID=A0ABQ6HDR2_9GAMM|nr:hypothetical protein [Thalassotalea loyana]GLX86243.1 hypothetical protein tloyanaT_24960 [Thalassotalea loyana]